MNKKIMPKTCLGKKAMNFFKAMCDMNRHKILVFLRHNGEKNATDIVKKMKLTQPTVSHHLKILVSAGILEARKEGKEIFYKVNKKIINRHCCGVMDEFCAKEKEK